MYFRAFQAGAVVKNLLADAGDTGLIPGSGRSLEGEMATHGSILAWEILRTEGPGSLQPMGSQRGGHDLATKQHWVLEQTLLWTGG